MLHQMLNKFLPIEFGQVDQNLLTRFADTVAAAIENEHPNCMLALGPTLGRNQNTRDIYAAAELYGHQLGTWAEGLMDEQKERLDNEAPDRFKCSISREMIRRPCVLVGSGEVYDRMYIRQWLSDHDIDPVTNTPLNGNHQLTKNATLEREICQWVTERI